MSETRHERAERRIREFEGYLEQARNKPAMPSKCHGLTSTKRQGQNECRTVQMKPTCSRDTKHHIP